MAFRWRGLLLALGLIGLVTVPAAYSATSHSSSTPDPGCDTSRSAVAFHSDGSTAAAPKAPTPCAVTTGYGGAESLVQVAPDGTVLEEPAVTHPGPAGTVNVLPPGPRPDAFGTGPAGFAVSRNRGGSWQLVWPTGTNGFLPLDNAFYIDPVTGRTYLATNDIESAVGTPENPPRLLSSSPPYTSWTMTIPGTLISENSRFTSAPAPAGYPPAAPGQDMAYWCGNVSLFGTGGRICERSFDGGATWDYASQLVGGPPPSECGADPGSQVGQSGEYPEGDNSNGPHRGSLWVLITCDALHSLGVPAPGATYLARSADEAATWPIIHKADGTPVTVQGSELRVDTAENLYAFELVGSQLLMRISQDGGLDWTAPLDMTAPSARKTTIGQWAVAIGKPGEVAVSYFAARSDGTGNDGYITVTHDALHANPVFYAATVNPPGQRLQSAKPTGTDFVGVTVGPDGTPWASFYSDCFKNANGQFEDPSCAQTNGQAAGGVPPTPGPGNAETVGHLSFPS